MGSTQSTWGGQNTSSLLRSALRLDSRAEGRAETFCEHEEKIVVDQGHTLLAAPTYSPQHGRKDSTYLVLMPAPLRQQVLQVHARLHI